MSEETKQKLRESAKARKAAKSTPHGDDVVTEAAWDEPVVVTRTLQRSPVIDFDALVKRHPSITLRNIYAQKHSSGCSKEEAFAEAVKMLGGSK